MLRGQRRSKSVRACLVLACLVLAASYIDTETFVSGQANGFGQLVPKLLLPAALSEAFSRPARAEVLITPEDVAIATGMDQDSARRMIIDQLPPEQQFFIAFQDLFTGLLLPYAIGAAIVYGLATIFGNPFQPKEDQGKK
mmetsp:Transcript_106870/g.189927  ORF Transcript_106870/g.189927 Transcript_106870/m.189927 type:complete len:140 (+) Transcript_106870:65-484(+)|eukprot:CAMPEP_0197657988 /NCGR_PEP_ID=MMETSP1338-20131121/44965_1 /TAXON_ID=43686 ORGANISM="Pelagodinium beii, Strain RCC1491" /NCGR_SAMPLE_ID=MMETSP1338 /ASSEMBLY_ACC=CAM_ASM_000754 /LENGTH=139 /DNA_ID=CAMNT_0043234481 /DNA_START=63 /DNA_END=482 /DNA_ORIENTATION=-